MEKTQGPCSTKYPLLLAHGIHNRDFRPRKYWGRIPDELRERGAVVFHGNQEAWGTIENNALILQERVFEIINVTGCKKVNIIAHSKGGLEARYMINKLEMDRYTASLTTLSTPHKGSRTMDAITEKLPLFLKKVLAAGFNRYARHLGDINPDCIQACRQLTTAACAQFNQETPERNGIFYQSYHSAMENWYSDLMMAIPYLIVKHFDGNNDGFVGFESAEWGNYRGFLKSDTKKGISHCDIVDFRQRQFASFRITDFYVQLVQELKNMGL